MATFYKTTRSQFILLDLNRFDELLPKAQDANGGVQKVKIFWCKAETKGKMASTLKVNIWSEEAKKFISKGFSIALPEVLSARVVGASPNQSCGISTLDLNGMPIKDDTLLENICKKIESLVVKEFNDNYAVPDDDCKVVMNSIISSSNIYAMFDYSDKDRAKETIVNTLNAQDGRIVIDFKKIWTKVYEGNVRKFGVQLAISKTKYAVELVSKPLKKRKMVMVEVE